jgi:LEA14-like dessication related protein
MRAFGFLKKSVRVIMAVSLLVFSGAVGCATLTSLDQPEIRSVQPRITGIDLEGVDLAFDVDVHNPYPVPIKASRFRYGIDVQDSRLFESEIESGIDFPAMSLGRTVLPVRLSYADLWRAYRELSDASEADYGLHGTLIFAVLGRSFELPLSHRGKVPVFRLPTFSDIRIESTDFSFTGVKLNINAAMKNPNVFPLGVKELGYFLKLGDMTVGNLTATTNDVVEAGQTDQMSLSGEVSAASVVFDVIRGGSFGTAAIFPSGSLQTPYGAVKLTE